MAVFDAISWPDLAERAVLRAFLSLLERRGFFGVSHPWTEEKAKTYERCYGGNTNAAGPSFTVRSRDLNE